MGERDRDRTIHKDRKTETTEQEKERRTGRQIETERESMGRGIENCYALFSINVSFDRSLLPLV